MNTNTTYFPTALAALEEGKTHKEARAAGLRTGIRVWFTNCGTEPQWQQSEEDDESYDSARPWTDEDTEELELWMDMEDAALAASSGTAETDW
jgi:hypothetical protein